MHKENLFFILFSVLSFKIQAIITKIGQSPEADMNFLEMAKSHGYPVWNKFIDTPDGYILNIYRIPGPQGESLS